MTREDRLRTFIDDAEKRDCVWGESDCCAWPANWVRQETGKRIALPEYADRESAHRHIAEAGGLLNIAAPLVAAAGLDVTTDPQFGDIGLIRLSDRDVGVIFCKSGIAVWRAERGTRFIRPVNVLAAWTV